MKQSNMNDAKLNLSHCVTDPAPKKTAAKPQIGVAKGDFTVPHSFFEPLSNGILKAFGGLS